jgi:hypothetical protein
MVWRKLTGKREPLPMVDMPVLPGGPPTPGSTSSPAATEAPPPGDEA